MNLVDPAAPNARVVGRYALYGAIAAGGMATVHLGRLMGPVGFSRTVAIKRLHAQFASDPEFVSMFLDEARLAARIRHPNVVPTLDVVATGGELFLVMDYVPGESLSRLARASREQRQAMPLRVLSAILTGVLHGLHSAHEAKDERGHPLGIVHRDVSPQNVLVGSDGVARVLDFGVAKAANRMQTTKEGQIKGKLAYMPPEQLRGGTVTRQSDIYATGVMLWELLTGQRLFSADNEGAMVTKILEGKVARPSVVLARSAGATLDDRTMRALESLDETTMRALRMTPEERFATAKEMALELERKCPPATASEVTDWVELIARDILHTRAALVAEIESSASMSVAELRDNGVMKVLNSPALGATGMGVTAHGPSPTDLGRTLALPSGGGSVSAPPMQTGPSGMPLAPRSSTATFLPPYVDGPPVTQPSSISVSQTSFPGTDAKDSKAKPVLAAVAGILVGLLVLGGAVYLKTRPTTDSPPRGDAPPLAPVQVGGPEASSSGAAPATPGTGMQGLPGVYTTSGGLAPPPSETTQPPPKPAPRPSVGKPLKPPTTTTTAPPPKPPVDDCNPNFTMGADGVKRFKPQCL
jgi:serine/threonine protein kinase